jgi:AhpD family alkylhydroperoxidase
MAECFYHPEESKRLRRLRELKPEAFKAFTEFDRAVFQEGELSQQVKELIAVATAHLTQCPYCIDVHTKRAKKAGASDGQIAEAIFVAMALRAGGSFAHAAIALRAAEEFDAKVGS